jgi:hypothetical protein
LSQVKNADVHDLFLWVILFGSNKMASLAALATPAGMEKAVPLVTNLAIGVVSLIFLIAGIAMMKKSPMQGLALFAAAGVIYYWGQTMGKQAAAVVKEF